MKTVIVMASSRSTGETRKLVDFIASEGDIDVIDLTGKNIAYFDYDYKNANDDFIPICEKIANEYDHIIFATPVYWYTMSAPMKTFFDRLYDLFTTHKDVGRKWKGKTMSVLSCGEDKFVVDGFLMPFTETAKYMTMDYCTEVHGWIEKNKLSDKVKDDLRNFINRIENFKA
ncbi:MAG: NAD(P)H-dependent oxidoreductase [Flavobacteriales bacterium]|nr:NAD(P)H-dependent oxidoreductase [Flavobacteriales bacterium]